MSQNDRVLAVLQDGNPKSIQTIHNIVGPCRLNSRIAELRKRGHDIICWRAKVGRDDRGRDVWTYYYRLVKPSLDAADGTRGATSAASSVGVADLGVTGSAPESHGSPSEVGNLPSEDHPPDVSRAPTLDSGLQLDLFDTRRQPAWA